MEKHLVFCLIAARSVIILPTLLSANSTASQRESRGKTLILNLCFIEDELTTLKTWRPAGLLDKTIVWKSLSPQADFLRVHSFLL